MIDVGTGVGAEVGTEQGLELEVQGNLIVVVMEVNCSLEFEDDFENKDDELIAVAIEIVAGWELELELVEPVQENRAEDSD